MGPYGSHQVLATAVFGRLAGFRTRALLTPQPDVAEIELNRRLLPMLRMEVMRCGNFADVPLTLVKARFKALAGSRPYWIPPGHNHPMGFLGEIEGAVEVAEAVHPGEILMTDTVVV